MKTIRDIAQIDGVKVLLRLDLNVPIEHGAVVDDFRIRKSLPTLKWLRTRGAKTIIVSHIEGPGNSEDSLEPIARYLEKQGHPVVFIKNYRTAMEHIARMNNGDVVLLENLRLYEGEKKNSAEFAKELASLADIYVNEAFSVSHRKHASVSAITDFLPSYAGLLFDEEVKNLSVAFHPQRPFLFILGGAKFETKIPLIEKFMESADTIFVGGALSNNFFKEQGKEIGISTVSQENYNLKRYFNSPKLMLPIDVVVVKDGVRSVKRVDDLSAEDSIMDAGPETMAALKKKINASRSVLWNGPLGLYQDGYKQPTLDLATMIADSGAQSVVGGGDTLAAIAELGIEDKLSFVSTGGGATLDFLANETLPGIEALKSNSIS